MRTFARRHLRLVLAVAVLAAVLASAGLWLRTSSLVAVERVEVSGIQGHQAKQIRGALTTAGLDMTTLALDKAALQDAVSAYPIVRNLRTTTDFPHGLRIDVNAYVPVATVTAGGSALAVAFDGVLLRGAPTRGLPVVGLKRMPAGDRVRDADAMRAIGLMAAAPAALRARIDRVFRSSRGISAALQDGPKLYFGGDERARAKWAAAAEVLRQSSSRGASYVDLRLPDRPVAGGFKPRTDEASGLT